MRRTLVILIVLAAALLVNASVIDGETRLAEPRDGGRLVGDINVRVEGRGPAVVLVHGFGSSIRWWSRVAGPLARNHRVIRVDLLGHGGSAAPDSGYAMDEQARAVAHVLRRLGVRRVSAVGHSMGGNVVTSLAEQFPQLVERVALIDSAPSTREPYASDLGPVAKLYLTPIVGQLLHRFRTDGAVRDGVDRAFARDVDYPERFLDDVKRLTYTAFRRSRAEGDEYREARSLPARLRRVRKPLLVIWGDEDRIAPVDGLRLYRRVRGARAVRIPAAGHTPMYERPRETLRALGPFLRR